MMYWENYLRELAAARIEGYRCAINALPNGEEKAKKLLIERLEEMFSSFPKIPTEELATVQCEPRSEVVQFRASNSELAAIKQRASLSGLSLTEYTMKRLLYDPWIPPFSETAERPSVFVGSKRTT